MPATTDASNTAGPPAWALTRASNELYDIADESIVQARAWAIVREVQQLQDEAHDEFDDPDQGGEG